MASRPAFAAVPERIWYLEKGPAETLLRNILASDYAVAREWGDLRVFRRKDWPGCPPSG